MKAIDCGRRAAPEPSAPRGLVFDIKRYAIHDGPGIRTTIYLKGCPLECAWCHNPEGQLGVPEIIFWTGRCIQCGACLEVCPEDGDLDAAHCRRCGRCVQICPAGAREMAGRWMGVREVMAEIGQDRVFYDSSAGGVTFSGGEPLQQPEFLAALLRACQEEEIHTAVDTCGFAAPSAFDQVSPDTDLFLYDLKLMDDAAHRHYTGVSNRLILENLRRLAHRGAAVTVRVPVIPGISDDAGNLDAIGRFVASLGAVNQVDLLPYHRMAADKYGRLHRKYRIPATEPPSTERMEQLAEGLRQWGIAVTIGG